ncbi:unnamed protein product, partial [marine sediment metagenome]
MGGLYSVIRKSMEKGEREKKTGPNYDLFALWGEGVLISGLKFCRFGSNFAF